MKTLTKSALKSAIRKIVLDAMSKVVKTARKNGFEIANPDWNRYCASDFEEFETVKQMIDKDGEVMFRNENIGDFREILADIEYNDLTLVSDADIEKFSKQYATARASFLEARAKEKAAAKETRAAKIARLRKQLAKLEAEENAA